MERSLYALELKNIEKENISLLNAELAASHFLALDEYHIRKCLITLQKEISEELSAVGPDKALLIYELNEYMNKEEDFYNAENAYKYGKMSYDEGLSFEDGFAQYRR